MRKHSRSLRIGYILNRFPKLQQSFVLNEVLALERLGHEVAIFSNLHPGPEQSCDVPSAPGLSVHYIDTSGPAVLFRSIARLSLRHPIRLIRTLLHVVLINDEYFWAMLKNALLISRQADADKIEHLHAHMRRGTDVAFLVYSLTGINFSFTAHTGNVYTKTRFMPDELATANFVITVCEYNKFLLATISPDAVSKIHVIKPFLDQELYLNASSIQHRDISKKPLHIVSVSRLVPIKGIDVLLYATSLVIQAGVPVKVSIVGEGTEREYIENLICSLNLSDTVSLTGARDAEYVSGLLRKSDCFVLASIRTQDGNSDATPTVIGEAMSLGIPVISTYIAGIPEIVPPGAGCLVETGNPAALSQAIIRMAKLSPTVRGEMGEIGRRFVQQRWNAESDAKKLEALVTMSIGR